MMRNRMATGILLAFAAVLPAQRALGDGGALARGDQLFAAKHYQAALDVYAVVLKVAPHDPGALRRAGACHVMIGEFTAHDQQMAQFKIAEPQLREAVQLAPRDAAAQYWFARVLGQEALFAGIWKSVSLGREIKEHIDIAIALDPADHSAYHVRARWHREVSEKPKIGRMALGLGDASLNKGLVDIGKALEIAPHHLNHHIEMARFDVRLKKKDEARAELTRALADPAMDDPEYRPEAEALLATLAGGK